ncbi:SMP-30/gluconolactonase/LRE family protein [Pseudonocardia dioxanivorans]|uniref:SMP-30/gluconolactonase/LRE family protein n=1 Tax=Pseudonocardia dioxanivorans TaxID=240495 RepID=UPI00131A5663|nr:SMP-30/gluconolactonase/LRE family protein [Pseudonocardia dioxanivorans]
MAGGLLEGPRYDSRWGVVYADAAHGGVHSLGEDGTTRVLIPHRRGIGGLVLHEQDGAVITGRNVAYKPIAADGGSGATEVLLDRDPQAHRVGFNDLTTDEAGRVYVGSLGFVAMHDAVDGTAAGPPGSLWVVDLDGSVTSLADDIALSNGMAFDPTGTVLYQCDSGRRLVFAYELDLGGAAPKVVERTVFAELPQGVPDGIAVDVEGGVWVALAHRGEIVGLGSDGRVVDTIPVPVPMVTSMCFGGASMRTLYIVTGAHGDPDDSAGIFACEMDVAGVPVPLARTPTDQGPR